MTTRSALYDITEVKLGGIDAKGSVNSCKLKIKIIIKNNSLSAKFIRKIKILKTIKNKNSTFRGFLV